MPHPPQPSPPLFALSDGSLMAAMGTLQGPTNRHPPANTGQKSPPCPNPSPTPFALPHGYGWPAMGRPVIADPAANPSPKASPPPTAYLLPSPYLRLNSPHPRHKTSRPPDSRSNPAGRILLHLARTRVPSRPRPPLRLSGTHTLNSSLPSFSLILILFCLR